MEVSRRPSRRVLAGAGRTCPAPGASMWSNAGAQASHSVFLTQVAAGVARKTKMTTIDFQEERSSPQYPTALLMARRAVSWLIACRESLQENLPRNIFLASPGHHERR